MHLWYWQDLRAGGSCEWDKQQKGGVFVDKQLASWKFKWFWGYFLGGTKFCVFSWCYWCFLSTFRGWRQSSTGWLVDPPTWLRTVHEDDLTRSSWKDMKPEEMHRKDQNHFKIMYKTSIFCVFSASSWYYIMYLSNLVCHHIAGRIVSSHVFLTSGIFGRNESTSNFSGTNYWNFGRVNLGKFNSNFTSNSRRFTTSVEVCARKGAQVVLLNRDSIRADEAYGYIRVVCQMSEGIWKMLGGDQLPMRCFCWLFKSLRYIFSNFFGGSIKISCSLTSHNKVQVLVVCFLLVGRLEEANLTLSSLMVPGRAETNYPPKGEMMGDVNSSEGDSSSFCVTDSLKLRPRSPWKLLFAGLFQRGSVSISLPWSVFLKSRIFSFEKKAPGKSPNVFVPAFQNCSQKTTATCGNVQSLGLMGEKKTVRKVSPGHCQTERRPWTLEDLLRPHVPWGKNGGRDVETTLDCSGLCLLGLVRRVAIKFQAMKSMKWEKIPSKVPKNDSWTTWTKPPGGLIQSESKAELLDVGLESLSNVGLTVDGRKSSTSWYDGKYPIIYLQGFIHVRWLAGFLP